MDIRKQIDDELVLCLGCGHCGNFVASQEELIKDMKAIKRDVVYCYNLDILDTECACYSATNPDNARFDIVCLKFQNQVILRGEFSDFHSWFPPYSWRVAHCSKCQNVLGWSFGKNISIEKRNSESKDIQQDIYDKCIIEQEKALLLIKKNEQELEEIGSKIKLEEDSLQHSCENSDDIFDQFQLIRLRQKDIFHKQNILCLQQRQIDALTQILRKISEQQFLNTSIKNLQEQNKKSFNDDTSDDNNNSTQGVIQEEFLGLIITGLKHVEIAKDRLELITNGSETLTTLQNVYQKLIDLQERIAHNM